MPNKPKNTFGQDISQSGGSIVPTSIPINSTTIAPQTATQLPQYPSLTNGQALNAGIPNPVSTPIPTGADVVNNANQPTGIDAQFNSAIDKLNSLIGGAKSQPTLTTQQENQAGVPGLQKTANDLATQIMGLNDQATKLQLDAAPGGTIENQQQLSAAGRGITAAGLAPLTAAKLRENQIQQNTIASQALTVKAAYYAANNNLTLARDAADRAAQVAFDAQEQQIKYQQSLVDSIKFQLGREDQKRAQILDAQLKDREQQLNWQREDFKTGQALAIAAMKLNPNDPAAQFAAQSALRINPNDPNYIQKVTNLVGQYQQDPTTLQNALLDQQLKRTQISQINENIQKTKAEIEAMGSGAPQVQAWADNIISGRIKLSEVPTTDRTAVLNYIASIGKKVPRDLNATQQTAVNNANDALNSMDTIVQQVFGGDIQNGQIDRNKLTAATGVPYGIGQRQLYTAISNVADVVARIRTGAQLNESELAFYKSQAPNWKDDDATLRQKTNQLVAFFSGISGTPVTIKAPDGSQYVYDDLLDPQQRNEMRQALQNHYSVVNF